MIKALFLDRDGVINLDSGYVHRKEDFTFLDGIFKATNYFQDLGYHVFVITNQAGIGRGYYTEEDFQKLTAWMLQEFKRHGTDITKVYYSPYHPEHGLGKYKKETFCRKPNPGMILKAAEEYDIDLSESIMVGDKDSDIKAGLNAGVGLNILLKSKYGSKLQRSESIMIIESLCELLTINFI